MKTLSIEASKILQEYMPEEVEYWYFVDEGWEFITKYEWYESTEIIKTLTLEEVIDMLPELTATIKCRWFHRVLCPNDKWRDYNSHWKTFLEAVEKMLLYLHKENLLTKK